MVRLCQGAALRPKFSKELSYRGIQLDCWFLHRRPSRVLRAKALKRSPIRSTTMLQSLIEIRDRLILKKQPVISTCKRSSTRPKYPMYHDQ